MQALALEMAKGSMMALFMIGLLFGPAAQAAWADNTNPSSGNAHPLLRVAEGAVGLACIGAGATGLGIMWLGLVFGGWTHVISPGMAILTGLGGIGAIILGGVMVWDATFNGGKMVKKLIG